MDAFVDNLPRAFQLDILLRIVLQIALFSASAFFSGSETALFSLSRFDLQRLAREKNPTAESLRLLLDQPRRLIVSILCGNEFVNIAAAANMTAILVALFGVEAAAWTAAFVMIPLILLLGEVTPKTLAVSNPVWASTHVVVKPISWWVRVVSPIAFIVRIVADRTTTLIVGPERAKENILHIEDLRTLIEEGVESGEITPTERSLVHSLITAGSTEVREIMTPRSLVAFLDGSADSAKIRDAFLSLHCQRAPIYLGNRDNVIGFLDVDDLLAGDLSVEPEDDLHEILRSPIAVSPTRQVDEMLDFFNERKADVALVVNEFGSVDGVVTLSDVTNFLFSGLFEAVATEQVGIVSVERGFEMDAGTSVTVARRTTGLELRDPLMTTMGGLALRQFGYVPAVGDCVQFDGLLLEVLEMDGLRISRIRLSRADAVNQDSEAQTND